MSAETLAPAAGHAPAETGQPDLRRLSPSRRSLFRALWDRRSVRAQLLITFVLIDVVAVIVAGSVTILKARSAARVEVAASMALAEPLVRETISLVPQEAPADQVLANLPLRLRFLRHVRILVNDAGGVTIANPATGAAREERSDVPGWFAALIRSPVERLEVPVIVKGQRVGSVVVVGEPGDEIAEVWDNTVALAAVGAGLNLAVIGILYVLFGRVLNPLTGVAAGLLDLERQNYKVRLPPPRARELAVICARFNALAGALDAARAENVRLSQRLVTAQDDERRQTARELHDEVGPCLFGLKANATSIATIVGKAGETATPGLQERVGDMLAIVEHLQVINRSLLNRLRPMALGHVPLNDLIADVVNDRARAQPQIAFSFLGGKLRESYGDSIDLTVYRCIQEGLTNAIRHAQAKRITVELDEDGGEVKPVDGGSRPELTLSVRDDGIGIAPGIPRGFGLLGMEERVRALGGRFALERPHDGGTRVSIVMPVPG